MKEILHTGLSALGLNTEKIPQLEAFSQLLLEKNQVMNLTAITDPAAIATLHFLDSAELLTMADFQGKRVIDVGSGAGFPGIPLRILEPDFDLVLLDSLGKRIHFLQDCCSALDLQRVECIQARAEEYANMHREEFDLVTSRAVAALPILCELCLPLVKIGGHFLAMKARDCQAELASAEHAIAQLGGKLQTVKEFDLPNSDVGRCVITIQKIHPTPAKYPRPFAKIKKAPL